ncbi:inhibitor of the pro-sigma K processing machinery [Tumebacillus sp. BK434]|uniref:pro-sigmaK processing inhibitor BofA family protein n=1 Tax=Tumebacillus sp. BK434 TaxID=2512169 RepID=UPI00104ACA72|nr:pro-sigmaK processing inhibitor BofA family protein [Tumebacillus sp. BK434]TCP52655.1 inhibitor of the pro-sigma K processing machinery [Tumebacillus sp. BK434]
MSAWQVIGMLVGAVVLIYMIANFMRDPGQAIMGMLRGLIVGVVALFVINLIGASFGFHIAINPVTAATTAILGLPGVAALVVMNVWMV